jgi:ABC-2 type transport system ATP-binding protein
MLCIRNYKKAYEGHTVLQIENLQLADGLYWLKGENGSGKTTFLKSLAGLIPFEGVLEVHGINLRKQRRKYTQIVTFAEAEPVYPSFLTGFELLQFYLQTKGGNEKDARQIAEVFDMTSYLNNKVDTYSSGMLKKLSLLLAFTGAPRLILLDEPLITLDVKAVETLQHLILAAHANGVSFLISSHQELTLKEPCQRLRIHQKTIEQDLYAAGVE